MSDKFILSKESFQFYNNRVSHYEVTEDIVIENLEDYLLIKNQIEDNLSSFIHRNYFNPILLNKQKTLPDIKVLHGVLYLGSLKLNLVDYDRLDEEVSLFVLNMTLNKRTSVKVFKKDLRLFIDTLDIMCDDIKVFVQHNEN